MRMTTPFRLLGDGFRAPHVHLASRSENAPVCPIQASQRRTLLPREHARAGVDR
jgi:hypothetical protein